MRIESISVMGIRLLLCVEAAVLGFGEWGESGVVMCWLLSEGRDVTCIVAGVGELPFMRLPMEVIYLRWSVSY